MATIVEFLSILHDLRPRHLISPVSSHYPLQLPEVVSTESFVLHVLCYAEDLEVCVFYRQPGR